MTIKNRILVALCHHGPASRAELSKRFGFSSSHVSEAVSELIETGILIESGYRPGERSRGRKNTMLDFNPSYKFALGIGFADNVLSIALTTVRGDVLGKEVINIDPNITKEELFDLALSATMGILRDCCLTLSSLIGIGLCVKRSNARHFYGEAEIDKITSDISDFSGQPVVYEPAEGFLQLDERIASVRPEELYLFGAAKVIRDLFLYGEV